LPKHVNANHDLNGRRPEVVEEWHNGEKELRIDRNQVGHLAHSGRFARRGRQTQTLLVNQAHQCRANASAHQVHAEIVMLQQHGLAKRGEKEQDGEENAHKHGLIFVFDEFDDQT
jgi:hypothetical protein